MKKSAKVRTIISIIVLLFANSAAGGAEWCSSALANIADTFPNVSYAVITLVNNIPNLCAVVFTLVAGLLVNRKVSLKTMILIGIGLHCVGGILPAIAGNESITMMFLGRFVFGIGYGLMQGIGVSMSFKLIEDEKLRVHAMGWAVAAQYGMNMVAQVVVGYLCQVRWNACFYVYAWSAIPFFIVLFLCPDFPINKMDYSAVGGAGSSLAKSGSVWNSIKALPSTVWAFTIISAVYMLCYYPMFLVISPIIVDHGLGTSVSVGYAMVFYSVATIVGGVIFGFVEKLCKEKTLCIFLIGVAVSCLGLVLARSYVMVCLWLTISGVTSSGIIPACINVYNKQVPESLSFLATSVTESGINIGAFLGTPYIALIGLFGGSAETTMLISPAILVIMGFVTVKLLRDAAKKNGKAL